MPAFKPEELLIKGMKELGITPSKEQVNAFMTYLPELKKWNKAYNLTAMKTDEDIIIKHFLDSLLYLKAIPEGTIKIADVGSGAGFPGIPMKIIRPEIETTLIEPSRKKSAFLRHIIRQLGLEKIEVIEKRVEDVGGPLAAPLLFDVAVTRALFEIKDFIKRASHIVKKGGLFILSKGPKVEEELKGLRGIRYELLTTPLPLTNIRRYIVITQIQR